jgi:predicted Zn-dependent peptidase
MSNVNRPRGRALRGAVLAAAVVAAALPAPAAAQAKQPPPAPGTPKNLKLAAKRTFRLDNGLEVTLVPFGAVPKTYVSLGVRTGIIDEGADEPRLSSLVAEMLDQGTTTRSAQQLADEAATMGGTLSSGAGADNLSITGEVLSEHAAGFVRLVADVAQHPSFPAEQFERVRADAIREEAIAMSQPGEVARDKFRRVMYGDHPYARVHATEAELKAHTVEKAKAWHGRNFGARRSHLFVVGVFDAAQVERAVREAFAGWAAGAEPTVNPPKPSTERSLTLLDRPGAVQSTLNLGVPVPDPSAADYTGLQVTNALLGGSFGSRITTNIREQKGYTYSPFSTVSSRYRNSYWMEVADVTTDKTGASLTEIFGEIDRLRREPPPAPELKGIQNYLAGTFTLQNGSRGGIAGQLQFMDVHGLGDEYLTGYVGRVMRTSPEDVRRIAEQYLVPERMTLVVVGDKKVVEPQLAPFQPKTVP